MRRPPVSTSVVCGSALICVTLASALLNWLDRPGLWVQAGIAAAAIILLSLALWLSRDEVGPAGGEWYRFAIYATGAIVISTLDSWVLVDSLTGASDMLPTVISAVPAFVSAVAAVIASLAALRAARRPRETENPSAPPSALPVANFYLRIGSADAVAQRDDSAQAQPPDSAGPAGPPDHSPPPVAETVRHNPFSAHAVARIVQNSGEADPADPLMSSFARSEVLRVAELLSTLDAGGDLVHDGENPAWLLSLAGHVRHGLDAVSLASVDGGGDGFGDGFWTSDLGYRYLEAQAQAIGRGVLVRRVFVGHDGRSEDLDLNHILREQMQLGVAARILTPESVPGFVSRRLFDFTLFDQEVSYEVSTAAGPHGLARPLVVQTRLVVTERRLADRIQLFETLWHSARAVEI